MSKKFTYGDLNPLHRSNIRDSFNSSNSSLMGSSKNAILKDASQDVLKGVNQIAGLKAIVLFAWEEAEATSQDMSTLVAPLSEIKKVVYIKARIPEIDAFPSPSRLPAANDPSDQAADWRTINLYQTFAAKDTAVSAYGVPSPGTIVYVTYEAFNDGMRSGGVYLGPVNVDDMPNPDALQPEVKFYPLSPGSSLFPPGTIPPFNLKGNWQRGLDKQRVMYLAQQLRLAPEIVGAFQMVESGGNPTVFAWNAHVFRGRLISYHGKTKGAVLLAKAKAVGLADSSSSASSRDDARKGALRSVYKSRAQKLFNLAYTQVDQKAAVAGGAWGNYQVLGSYAMRKSTGIDYILNSPNPAAEVLKRFQANPAKFSDDMLIAWVKANGGINGKWWSAANSTPPNYEYIVTKYYGGRSLKYVSKLSTYHQQFLREGTFRTLAQAPQTPPGEQ